MLLNAVLLDITNGHTPSSRKSPATNEGEEKPSWDWSSLRSKVLVGSVVSLTSAVTWVAFSQLLQNSFSATSFDAPFTLTYFILLCYLLLFPAYLCIARLANWQSTGDNFREGIHVYSMNDEFYWVSFLWKSLLFCLVTALTLYTYFRALFKLSAADCTALFAAHHSFVYLMSWIVLFEKFVAMRIFAMIFSITGIVLFAYVDGFGSPAMFGVVMGVAASSGAAVYGVLYKKFIGVATPVQAFFFLSNIGLFALLLLWPIWLLLYLFGVEVVVWAQIPFSLVLPASLLLVVCMVTKESCVLLTYPVFLGLGLVMAVPICALGDTVWKHREFSGMKIAALVLITIGVLLILLPEHWHDFICRRLRSKRQEGDDDIIGNSTTLRGRLRRTSYM
ncbi:solute carrier family 35 member f4-like protein [Plakobranchus ocellatus]|uniref:Solute carrier family 35 member f4-like protein n=1 Tax=Plakobranchus ocellatus TaxID=259542 RepID=A0AAV4AZ58_9GAST|nr:solute carrier family 35 member f4-like protein [Plakobranchus ocellatus]